MTWVIIAILAIVVIAIIYTIATFNGLIRLQQRADEGFSDIDVQLKRRHDLIPNLVETVKGYASHERQTFENVTAARNAAVAATGPEAQAQAENQLTGALRQLFAVAENYPDLKASQNFLELQNELTDTEDKIQAARRFYNMTVRDLNIKVQSFPSSVDRERPQHRRARLLRDRGPDGPCGADCLVRHGAGPGRLAARAGPPRRLTDRVVQADQREQAELDLPADRVPAPVRRARLAVLPVARRGRVLHRAVRGDLHGDHQPVRGRRPGRARERGAAGEAQGGGAGAVAQSREPRDHRGASDAAPLHLARGRAQCVRGRPQSEAGDRVRDHRPARPARRGGAGGRARPRDEPHPQLRRAPDDLGRRAGRLDRAARVHRDRARCGSAAAIATGAATPWSSSRWWRERFWRRSQRS